MEIKKVRIEDKEVEIYIENDPEAFEDKDLYESLDDTQDMNLEEIKNQYNLENTMIIKKDEVNGQ